MGGVQGKLHMRTLLVVLLFWTMADRAASVVFPIEIAVNMPLPERELLILQFKVATAVAKCVNVDVSQASRLNRLFLTAITAHSE